MFLVCTDISNACNLDGMEPMNESYDRLIHTSRVPRLVAYITIVKGYFNARRCEDIYAYERDIEVKSLSQVHKMLSFLARLHQMNGEMLMVLQGFLCVYSYLRTFKN
ncbi:hypothetical protein Hanom_Chr16g01492321 [Helianthus anomalus]